MEGERVLRMNDGTGKTSYANNSRLARAVIAKAKPVLEENIKEVYAGNMFPECLKVADLGCSSGPNTLIVVSQMLDAIATTCTLLNRRPPALQVFLNDLPGNDFNTLFKSLPSFYEEVKKKGGRFGACFTVGAPGSFYRNLFPNNTMHFVHSSYSLHWLSRVPKELETGQVLNKGNICIAKTSPPGVFKAYFEQFERDFTLFLRWRSEEIVPRGGMVLTVMGSVRSDDPCFHWELLGRALNDMVLQGLVPEAKLDSFNLPYYGPTVEELRRLTEAQGSFTLNRLEVFNMEWDPNMNRDEGFDEQESGKLVSDMLRAVGEPMLKHHFGLEIMDDLFSRVTEKIIDCIVTEKWQSTNLNISLTRKGA
ncbi:Salicylate/benzoate carboxyl methyltransferase [Vitis vinifera]|uniref:Salicylate/benzoate carboxyl methyltransferase n=1 Tax=Vitis vinifera TaxID=29760 RepID=A0A438EKL4_VITVI|nr:Salicylate/benzoate carboxyl methyltransferase [Vitis vinifera]